MKRVIVHCAWCDRPIEAIDLGKGVGECVCTECEDPTHEKWFLEGVATHKIESENDCPFMMHYDGWWCTHPSRSEEVKEEQEKRSDGVDPDDLYCSLVSAPNAGCPFRDDPFVRFVVLRSDVVVKK